jgi:PDZ domain-containing protein
MEHRTTVILVAGFGAVLLAALMMLLPVPYVILRPGPVLNTLGTEGGKPLISITGHPTYPAKGQLDLTTVSELGGSGRPVSLLAAIQSWIDRTTAVLPRDAVIPKGQTPKQTDEQNRLQMASSQENATAAALATLGIRVPTELRVAGVAPDSGAGVTLKPEDVITAVGGVRVLDLKSLSDELQKVKPGQAAEVTVRRGGQTRTVRTVTDVGSSGRTILRIFIAPKFRFPFQVKIQIENIGGPSAGTMFALGIIDLLTPGDLTGGKRIAGTGTMDATGTVGRIGGIQQKLVGARKAGAAYFLAPVDNCPQVRGHIPDGLTVVSIGTLDEAQAAVTSIAAGRLSGLPGC